MSSAPTVTQHETARDGTTRPAAVPARAYHPILDVLRIAAICGVVLIHVVGQLASVDGMRNPGWYAAATIDALSSWAVPVFVMLSGALILRPSTFRHGTGSFLARRAGRIVPALIVWTVVYEALIWQENGTFSWAAVAVRLIDGKTYSHLYFLWLIAGLYVIAPAVQKLLENGGARRAWTLGGVAAVWSTLVFVVMPQWRTDLGGEPYEVQLSALTMFLPWIGYFVLGRAIMLSRFSRRTGVVLLLVFAVLQAWTVFHYITLPEPRAEFWAQPPRSFRPQEVIAAVALFAGVWTLAGNWQVGERWERVLRTLGQATFGVFLTHFLFIELFAGVIPGAGTDPQRFPALLAVAAATIGASFVASLVLARIPGLRRAV